MEPIIEQRMEDLIEKAEETLSKVKNSINFFKWLVGITSAITLLILGVTMETRVQVVNKADASEIKNIYESFVQKQDAKVIHQLQDEYYMSLIKYKTPLDSIKEDDYYEWFINKLFDSKTEF